MDLTILNGVYFGNTILQFLKFFGYIAAAILIGKILYYLTTGVIRKLTSKTKTQFDDILIDMIEEPLVFLIVIGGFYLGYHKLTLTENAAKIFSEINGVLLTICVAWFILRLLDSFIVNYLIPLSKKTESDLDDHLVPMVRTLLKLIIITITGIVVVDNFGYDVTSVLAGLGIGGLAFALAAQDMIKNFFGGIVILLDKPFKIGQWVDIGGYEGEIMEIGMRSTKIKTQSGECVSIPNSFVAEKATKNFKKYPDKGIQFVIGLTYETSNKKMERAKEIVKQAVTKQKLLVPDSLSINFVNFGSYSLDLDVRYKLSTNDAAALRNIKDEINTYIKEKFDKEKIEFAYPTQSVYLSRE
ncbi:MAG: mechanosensitive ion channel family protein [archaeon]